MVHLPVGMPLHPQNKSSSTHDTPIYEGHRWCRPMCHKKVCPSHVLQLRHCLAPRDVSLASCFLSPQETILLLVLQLTMIQSMLHYSPLPMRVLLQLIWTLTTPSSPRPGLLLQSESTHHHKIRHEMSVKDNYVFQSFRLIMPDTLRQAVSSIAHESFQGAV